MTTRHFHNRLYAAASDSGTGGGEADSSSNGGADSAAKGAAKKAKELISGLSGLNLGQLVPSELTGKQKQAHAFVKKATSALTTGQPAPPLPKPGDKPLPPSQPTVPKVNPDGTVTKPPFLESVSLFIEGQGSVQDLMQSTTATLGIQSPVAFIQGTVSPMMISTAGRVFGDKFQVAFEASLRKNGLTKEELPADIREAQAFSEDHPLLPPCAPQLGALSMEIEAMDSLLSNLPLLGDSPIQGGLFIIKDVHHKTQVLLEGQINTALGSIGGAAATNPDAGEKAEKQTRALMIASFASVGAKYSVKNESNRPAASSEVLEPTEVTRVQDGASKIRSTANNMLKWAQTAQSNGKMSMSEFNTMKDKLTSMKANATKMVAKKDAFELWEDRASKSFGLPSKSKLESAGKKKLGDAKNAHVAKLKKSMNGILPAAKLSMLADLAALVGKGGGGGGGGDGGEDEQPATGADNDRPTEPDGAVVPSDAAITEISAVAILDGEISGFSDEVSGRYVITSFDSINEATQTGWQIPIMEDMEAASVDQSGNLWVTTSHSVTKSGNDRPERRRLLKVTDPTTDSRSFTTYEYLRETLTAATACPPELSRSLGKPANDKGFNIEGMTFDASGVMYLGFRGPLAFFENRAIVAKIEFPNVLMEYTAEADADDIGLSFVKVPLGGLGIRDLFFDSTANVIFAISGTLTDANDDFNIVQLQPGTLNVIRTTAIPLGDTDAGNAFIPEALTNDGSSGLVLVSDNKDGATLIRRFSYEDLGITS